MMIIPYKKNFLLLGLVCLALLPVQNASGGTVQTLSGIRVGGCEDNSWASAGSISVVAVEASRGSDSFISDFAPGCLLAPKGETVVVRHYTDTATRELINKSGSLNPGTHVTLPSEIPPQAGHLQIEKLLEIKPGRGSTYIDVEVPASNLRIPANGPTTSGNAWQRQLIEPTPIDPNLWRRPPGRPVGR